MKEPEAKLSVIRDSLANFSRRNAKTVGVFILYVVSIFLFAAWYQRIYLSSSDSFWFNQDISKSQYDQSKTQREVNRKVAAAAAAQLTAELDVINMVFSEFKRDPIVIDASRTTARSYSGYLVWTRMGDSGSGGNPLVWLDVSILDPKANLSLGPDRMYLEETPESVGGWVHLLAHLQADYQQQLDKQLEHLQSSGVDPIPSKIWSYWDFFYFSTMTQTTVGYGDILPNTTKVRLWVCGQVFWGYFLLIVIINLAFAKRSSRPA